jgi:anti-anti-sigma factor
MPSQNTTSRVPLIEVIITEELDSHTAPRLEARLHEALDLRPVQLIVDLAECPMVDAAAIGVLLDAHRKTRLSGCLLTLRGPSPKLRRNLRLARVDGVIDVIPKLARSQPAPAGSAPGADAVHGDRL